MHLTLGEAGLGVEDLSEIGDRQLPGRRRCVLTEDALTHDGPPLADLSVRRPRQTGWRRRPSGVHSREPDLADRRRADPVGALPLRRRKVARRTDWSPDRSWRVSPRSVGAIAVGEPGPDLPDIGEAALRPLGRDPEQQRAEGVGPVPLALGPAADDHLLGPLVLDLDPVRAAAHRAGRRSTAAWRPPPPCPSSTAVARTVVARRPR